ncbi:MAG: hypothetical protein ACK5V2_00850, partial [Pseudomonadota bacterium]
MCIVLTQAREFMGPAPRGIKRRQTRGPGSSSRARCQGPLGRLVDERDDVHSATPLRSGSADCFAGRVIPVCGGWLQRRAQPPSPATARRSVHTTRRRAAAPGSHRAFWVGLGHHPPAAQRSPARRVSPPPCQHPTTMPATNGLRILPIARALLLPAGAAPSQSPADALG